MLLLQLNTINLNTLAEVEETFNKYNLEFYIGCVSKIPNLHQYNK